MAGTSALYSKLRILVAKLYKAEKLYSSMSNLSRGGTRSSASDPSSFESLQNKQRSGGARHPSRSRTPTNNSASTTGPLDQESQGVFSSALLIEYANEVRSVEWYRVHYDYRCKLNEIFSDGSNANLPLKLNKLWHDFVVEFQDAEKGFIVIKDQSRDAFDREEYSFLFKASAELIRRRARLQALKVIHDELESLISPEQRLKGSIYVEERNDPPENIPQGSNVFQLKRRFAR